MMSVEHLKIVISKYAGSECALYLWRAPGSITINSRVKWGDGSYSPVTSNKYVSRDITLWEYAQDKFHLKDDNNLPRGYQKVITLAA